MGRIRLGIGGLGRGFMLTQPALRDNPLIRLAGAFDVRSDAVAQFAQEYSANAYNSFDEMLGDPDIDAVYIATPHEYHAEQSIAALKAGKHVLVEKPMATDVGQCVQMARCAEATGRVLVVGPSHGFDAQVIRASELVASQRFGHVRMVTALNFTDFMYRPRRPEELDEARGAGVIYSQAAHQIDIVRRIVADKVVSIRALTGDWDEARPGTGAYSALMSFANGVAASLTYSGYAHYDSDELAGWISELGQEKDPSRYGDTRRALETLTAEEEAQAKLQRTYPGGSTSAVLPSPYNEHFGFLLVSCDDADLKVLPTGIEIYGNSVREHIDCGPPEIPRAAVIEEFAAAITGTRRALHDAEWGLFSTACCAAIAQSGHLGRDVDPGRIIQKQTENIPDESS